MGMKVPKLTVKEYLRLLKDAGCMASKVHALQNQSVREGVVYFRDRRSITLFKDLLIASKTGIPPAHEYYRKMNQNKKFKEALGFITFDILVNNIKNLTGPDGSGWYRGQCPSCEMKETDEGGHTKDSLCFNDNDGRIVCHKGCHISDISTALRGGA